MNEIYLLVGGEATRLQPLSTGIPKALLKVQGEKIIDLIIQRFSKFGSFKFNLICSDKHEKQWIEYKDSSKDDIELLFEKTKLDTAGYIIQNLNSMPDSFYCMNGDLLLDIDLKELIIESTTISNSLIGSIEVEDPTRYGVLQVTEENKVERFIEKPDDDRFGKKISLGLYHLYKKDLQKIVSVLEIPCSFERDVFPKLAEQNLLNTYTAIGKMIDVGTIESYISSHLNGDTNWISPNNVSLSNSANITNSVVLDNCIIEDEVIIEDSIISDGSVIKSGSVIRNQIIRTNLL
jgi:NDP-sugar pyrophosphorylase family protein